MWDFAARVGSTVLMRLYVMDPEVPANNPVTGQSATVSIRRTSDDKWWNFLTTAWEVRANWAALVAGNKQALTDKGDGSYSVSWNQATADGSADREYVMVYCIAAGTYQGMDSERWRFLVDMPEVAELNTMELDTATGIATFYADDGITALAQYQITKPGGTIIRTRL